MAVKHKSSPTFETLQQPQQNVVTSARILTADGSKIVSENTHVSKKRENAKALAAGYTPEKRRMEIINISIFSTLFLISLYRSINHFTLSNAWNVIIAALLGILSADFLSGLIHWAADTWGTVDWPVVGQTFIRSFREHHVDPVAMCKHDIIETNGDNCMVGVVILATSLFTSSNLALWYVTFLGFYAALTNQIHKWSHTLKPPKYVALLQDLNIILPRKHHAVHHREPHDRYYCITTGWMNRPLEFIGFFRRAEALITKLTGWQPRDDDMNWTDLKEMRGSS